MSKRISPFIALILAMGVLTYVSPASASSSSQKKMSELRICPKYVFLGMRGSGQKLEPGSDVGVFGPELASLLSELKKIPAFIGNLESNYPDAASYKALGVSLTSEYVNEVRNEAPTALNNLFNSYTKRCESDTKFILAGYSQGAYAVHWLVTHLERMKDRPELKSRILAAITLANPGNPKTGLMAYFNAFARTPLGKDSYNAALTCAAAADFSGNLFCGQFFALVAKNAVNDVLPPPQVIPMFTHHREEDLVADIGSNNSFKLLVKSAPIQHLNQAKILYLPLILAAYRSQRSMSKTHSSYCPQSGPFSRPPADKCSDSNNADFVKQATNHVIKQLAKRK